MPSRKPSPDLPLDVDSQTFLEAQLHGDTLSPAATRRDAAPAGKGGPGPAGKAEVAADPVTAAATMFRKDAPVPMRTLPDEVVQSAEALEPRKRSFHGAKFSLAYFPGPMVRRPCADRFCYQSAESTRASTKLPFTAASRTRLEALGAAMAAPGGAPVDSTLDAGLTYVGQFIDHDVTLDVSSSLDVPTDAGDIHNMRTPVLDLDSVYGRGPALDPFLYDMPGPGQNPTAIRLQVGTNLPSGPGGPSGPAGPGGMVAHSDRDVPRMAGDDHTAVIGDPRNDENLIVVQLHHAMLRFHNVVVDALVASGFTGDVFVEARRRVTQHYQWAVVHDFLVKICGQATVDTALRRVRQPVRSGFCMPVEFSVAAYRFGHSMVRGRYFVNFNFPQATLAEVFQFNRNPHLPVRSNWVVDLNAYFPTGAAPADPAFRFNKALKIDTALTNGLDSLPGFTGLMARLATRNLLRGLALGLPSGQGMADELGVTPLTSQQILQGLRPAERDALRAGNNTLLKRTPLWYYVLREAAVLHGGNQLGPVGGRIVAETFVRMLKRDPDSFLNEAGGFTPFLPSDVPGQFTFTDLVKLTGMHLP